MSLSEALLWEPPLVTTSSYPQEIWIALRSSDQLYGSGTRSDPFDGSTRKAAPVQVSLIRGGLVATATSAVNHGYTTGDLVEISGVTGTDSGCAIRNCYVDDQFVYGPVISITGISVDAQNVVTLTTALAHGHAKPGDVLVRGVAVLSGENSFHGLFAIEDIPSTTQLKYKLLTSTPPGMPSISGSVGGGVPSRGIEVKAPSLGGEGIVQVSGLKYRLETAAPHLRTANNKIKISGVYVDTAPPRPSQKYNGIFKIEKIISPTKLEFWLEATPEALAINYNYVIFTGVGSAATSADGGTAAVLEGNRIFNCATGGPYHDYWSTLDLIGRNNYYFDVTIGPQQNLGDNVATYQRIGKSLIHTGPTAKFFTETYHGLKKGDVVHVSNALLQGPVNPYNGYFNVDEVGQVDGSDDWFFTYTMSATPAGDAENPGPDPNNPIYLYFGRFWQVGAWIMENNVMECSRQLHCSGYGGPMGALVMATYAPDPAPQFIYHYKNVAFNGNCVSKAHYGEVTDWLIWGLIAGQSRNALLEDNVLQVPGEDYGVLFNTCQSASAFNNRKPSGERLRLTNNSTGSKSDDLSTRIEDAWLMAF